MPDIITKQNGGEEMGSKKNKYPGRQRITPISKDSGNHIYNGNMKALRKRYPELANRVEKPNICNYEIRSNSPSRIPNLYSRSKSLYYYDIADPLKDVVQQITELKLRNTRIAFFLGIGLGYELMYYLGDTALQQNTNFVLVVERDLEIFKLALQTTDMVQAIEHQDIAFFIDVEPEDLYVKFRDCLAMGRRFILARAMNPVYHPSALKLNKDYYINVLKVFRESVVHQISTFGDSPEDSLIGLNNMLANLDEIIQNPGINMLYKQFQNRPAIIVSTGPSLNKNKHLLKGLEEKAVIIAPDASLRILRDMGVKPHLVTSLERVPQTAKLLEGFTSQELEEVYLAACPVVMPECYAAYDGPRIIVYRNFDHFRWIGIDKGILDIQLSAGNMAFKVAEALGCNPIILIGQDLAFARSGETHARGTFFGEKQDYLFAQDQLQVPGNDGEPITTTKVWYSFLKAYEMDLATYQGQCINATEGGAYIPGTSLMPFARAIQEYIGEDFDPRQHITRLLSIFTSENAQQDRQTVLQIINKTISGLESITSYCLEGIKTCESFRPALESALASPDEMSDKLRSELPAMEGEMLAWRGKCHQVQPVFQNFLVHIIQSYYIKFEIEMVAIPGKYTDPDLALIDILLHQVDWYAVVADICQICRHSLSEARDRILE